MIRLFLAVALQCLALVPMSAGAQSSTTITALPDCQGAPHERPANVVFACGDGGVYASNLRWSRWGEQFAAGNGTLEKNDCTPNCAQGHMHASPVTILVAGRQRCPNGQIAYQEAAYVPLASGIPNVGEATTWFTFKCSPQP
jgi:hypothetical protein